MFTTVTTSAYQGQLNSGFSKVCEIFKFCGIESLKYVWEFYTQVCYCGDIYMQRNVTLNETNCDWLFDRSNGLMGGPWPMKAAIYSRPSAVSQKVWLRETKYCPILTNHTSMESLFIKLTLMTGFVVHGHIYRSHLYTACSSCAANTLIVRQNATIGFFCII